jgi:hypothetical protein
MSPFASLRDEINLRFVIDRAEVETAARDERESLLLSRSPVYGAFAFMGILGIGLLVFWRFSGDRDLALFVFVLVTGSAYPLFNMLAADEMTRRHWDLIYGPLQFLTPFAAVRGHAGVRPVAGCGRCERPGTACGNDGFSDYRRAAHHYQREPWRDSGRAQSQPFRAAGRGVVTCCVARINPQGKGLIANAGHIAPYTDGP